VVALNPFEKIFVGIGSYPGVSIGADVYGSFDLKDSTLNWSDISPSAQGG
jgi:hypothetical protein